jgi:hypothetical protein
MGRKFIEMSNLLERLQNGTTQKETSRSSSAESARSSEIEDATVDCEDERDDEEADALDEVVETKKKRIKKRD